MKRIFAQVKDGVEQAALEQDGLLAELLTRRADDLPVTGNIYAGIVKNIVTGRFAFIDIGLDKNAFLDLADGKEAGLFERGTLLLKSGQTVLVQVTKEPLGEKGAAVTTQLSFSGRDVVLYKSPHGAAAVSKKIDDPAERARLKGEARALLAGLGERACGVGVILRTASRGKTAQALGAQLLELADTLERTERAGVYAKAPSVVWRARNGVAQLVTELICEGVQTIEIQGAACADMVRADVLAAGFAADVKTYDGPAGLFDERGVTRQIERALARKVWLKCGGFIVIEQTEAFVSVDVNTGKCTTAKKPRDAVLTVNIEAALELARQLRLRNLSGMIVADFLEMKPAGDNDKLLAVLSEAVKQDRAACTVLGMTFLGVVMLTRKKNGESLERTLQRCRLTQ